MSKTTKTRTTKTQRVNARKGELLSLFQKLPENKQDALLDLAGMAQSEEDLFETVANMLNVEVEVEEPEFDIEVDVDDDEQDFDFFGEDDEPEPTVEDEDDEDEIEDDELGGLFAQLLPNKASTKKVAKATVKKAPAKKAPAKKAKAEKEPNPRYLDARPSPNTVCAAHVSVSATKFQIKWFRRWPGQGNKRQEYTEVFETKSAFQQAFATVKKVCPSNGAMQTKTNASGEKYQIQKFWNTK